MRLIRAVHCYRGCSGAAHKRHARDRWATRIAQALTTATLCAFLLSGCGNEEAPQAEPEVPAAPSQPIESVPAQGSVQTNAPGLEEAAELAYIGLDDPVVLTGGKWEGAPYSPGGASRPTAGLVPDMYLSSDLNQDGNPEGVVWLWTSAGGSGVFMHMAVIGRDSDGQPKNLATVAVGDRVQIRSVSSAGNMIVMDTVEAGPDDPMCCGAQKLRRQFEFLGSRLEEKLAENQGRMGLADLDGSWTLYAFNVQEMPLTEEPMPTFTANNGAIEGFNGCNNYGGRLVEGEMAGQLEVGGPMLSTRKACDSLSAEREQRYMKALGSINGLQFLNGRLGLKYDDGMLLFDRNHN